MREMVGGCCVCSDDRGWSENPLVYCDGQSCTVAVHQACYGIVSVPTGPWYCRKCESQERTSKVKCELCPSRYGALKRTDNAKWAHVVCALYIPEVRFGNVTTMEPILLHLIPAERFNKVCYICEEKGKPSTAAVGACMSCNRIGCKQQFHVTCGQSLGLLCEEAGNYLDNVKYCGYCQYHYSKLKKGGNVKTIPPYKPVSEKHLSDSGSEKEAEAVPSTSAKATSSSTSSTSSANSSNKRRSTSSTKTSTSSKTSSGNSKSSSSPSNSKTSHHNSKSSDKSKVNSSSSGSSRSTKNSDNHSEHSSETKTDKKDSKSENSEETKSSELKESKGSKKRKSNSRTPTPVTTVVSSEVNVINSNTANSNNDSSVINSSEKKEDLLDTSGESVDKAKKIKVETTQSIISNQPVVALTSISTIKATPPPTTSAADPPVVPPETSTVVSATAQSIIQSTAAQPLAGSLVVSLPLPSTTLSPQSQASTSAQGNLLANIIESQQEKTNDSPKPSGPDLPSNLESLNIEEENAQSNMLTSESGGGLKIIYEKQEAAMSTNTTEEDMELEEIQTEVPAKRTRSQSNDKTEKTVTNRGKKRSSGGGLGSNSNSYQINNNSNSNLSMRRSSRSQMNISPTPSLSSTLSQQPGAFASISQNQLKNSPPSSPSSESQSALPTRTSKNKTKGRKTEPAVITPSSSRDNKDVKLFQNGVTAPHMLGNQLNPTSNMAQKMSDHLNSELEAHSIFNPNENSNLVGPQLHHKVVATARSNSTGSTTSGNSGLTGMLGGNTGNIPQTLDQLLERQWEQGSQFLMEQAQHFDIASLLSCLHQLRAENLRLEEHVSSLLQRRDHLLAVNARLAIPLTGQPATPQTSHPHTVNNIHPAVAAGHGDVPRSRHSAGSASYPAHPQGTSADVPVENGLPPDSNQTYSSHRSPVTGQPQRSPTVRLSPAGSSFSNNSLIRPNPEASGRSNPRPQQYSHYQGSSQSQQQQILMRRDNDHHQSSKPS
ncbi:protein AF-10 isoform X3 [Harmonia axyridis]|uniref:protein AF-10 isoform X3 n=1 Tax=Harmonia axyridis TaxID=115357 RepID=UPI001E2795FE|nr:protein AF-10 isoform X3 [Harmonia axyridis]